MSDAKQQSRGIAPDLSAAAIARRLEILAELDRLARMLRAGTLLDHEAEAPRPQPERQ